MTAHWHYSETQPFYSQGKDTTRRNFSREERSEVAILIREGLQNPLDARREDTDDPVRVVIRNLAPGTFDRAYLDRIANSEFRSRLKAASDIALPHTEDASLLVIEDFGTNGLLGDYVNFNADGQGQNWNAFWHREGEGSKGLASNGGAGQGKITYFAHSSASAIFGLTVRSGDSKRLLMGKAQFPRDYQFHDDKKYYRAAYWTTSDSDPLPEEDSVELDSFADAFRLKRTASETGLSLVIPFSKSFDKKEAVRAIVLDFYLPIAAGRLAVSVDDVTINDKTIDAIADRFVSDEEAIAVGSSFTKSYRAFARKILEEPGHPVVLKPGWNKERVIPEDAFPEGSLATLRTTLESGGRICVRLPISLKRKGGAKIETWFETFLELPDELQRNEEAFVRRDLLIGAESHVMAGAFVQKTRSLTRIQEKELSDFLLSAEEPTHLKWNASLARDNGEYVSPDVALRSIRQAVPRLLAVLLRGDFKKDFRSLARYFAKPASSEPAKPGQTGDGNKPNLNVPRPPPPPPPEKKLFRIEAAGAAVRVAPNGNSGPRTDQLPIKAVLELAYEGLDHDPFEAYDPYDFDLSHGKDFPVVVAGATVMSIAENRIEALVESPNFFLEVRGFNPHMRVRARLEYELTQQEEGQGADANE